MVVTMWAFGSHKHETRGVDTDAGSLRLCI